MAPPPAAASATQPSAPQQATPHAGQKPDAAASPTKDASFDSALASANPQGQPTGEAASTPALAAVAPTAVTGSPTTPPEPANGNEAPASTAPTGESESITPERQQQISRWVNNDSDASGGFLGIGQTTTADKLKTVLGGTSELGQLSPTEQRYTTDRMLDRWDAGHGDGAYGAMRFANQLDETPQLSGIVGERMAVKSAAIMAEVPPGANVPDELLQRQAVASAMASTVVTTLSGQIHEPGDIGPLREMVTSLSPEQAAGFGRALGGNPSHAYASQFNAPLTARTLEAFNGAPHTASTSAFTQNAFATTSRDALAMSPELRTNMAQALAREWHPDDAGAAGRETERLSGILETRQGQQLLGAGEPGKPPLEARINALATVRQDTAITGEALGATDDPWTSQAIIGPQAQQTAQRYLAGRGDGPVTLAGTDLDNTIGYAMGMAPTIPAGMSSAEMERQVANGQLSLYGQGENAEAVRSVVDQIRDTGGSEPQVVVLPVTYSSSETGPVQLPLFRVTGTDGQKRFVDNVGRSYESFDDWRENNKLPPGSMTYPEDGHLTANAEGQIALAHGNTPDTADTFGEHLSNVVDKAALVGGIVAGGVLIIGSGGTLAPAVIGVAGAVAVGAGGWGVYRGGSELVDRADHGQSIDPIQDETARGLWLNVGASALAVGAFGSAARLAQLGRAGRALAPLEASAHGYVQAGAAVLDTAAIANEGVTLAQNWDKMSGEQRAQSLLNMGFWAAGTGVAARAGGVRSPGEMFNPIAIRDNLLRNYPPPVASDANLQGNAVQIDYDPQTGVVQGIRHGPDATQADIDLHVQTAQNIQRSLTLEGQVASFFRQNGEPPAGTVGWAARHDIAKVRERMQARAGELGDPSTGQARREEISRENAIDQQHLDELATETESFVRDPSQAFIEAKNNRQPTQKQIDARSVEKAAFASGERAKLEPGEHKVTHGDNEATYTINDDHQLVKSEATIRAYYQGDANERSRSERDIQSAVGHEAGRGSDTTRKGGPEGQKTWEQFERDEGGHAVAHQWIGDQGVVNLFPQNSELNQITYASGLEAEVNHWIDAGGEVKVTTTYGDGKSWGGDRPDRVQIEYEVRNSATGDVVWRDSVEFKNERGQVFEGFGHEIGLPPGDKSANGIDMVDEMRKRLAEGE